MCVCVRLGNYWVVALPLREAVLYGILFRFVFLTKREMMMVNESKVEGKIKS